MPPTKSSKPTRLGNALPPHAATLIQPKARSWFGSKATPGPPHSATVAQRKRPHSAQGLAPTQAHSRSPWPAAAVNANTGAIQRMEALGGLLSFFTSPSSTSSDEAALRKWKADVSIIAKGQLANGFAAPGIYQLIEQGPFFCEHPEIVLGPRELDPVSRAMGLTSAEELALYKYSQGKKDEVTSYGYMAAEDWRCLTTAVAKIPSLGQLGIVAPVFRGDRTTDFADFLRLRVGSPCYIVHGAATTASGTHHLASAAFVANSHGTRAKHLVRILCASARYVQYWGMHGGSLDGGEVLIPAGTITYYDGEHPHVEAFAGEKKEIFTLIEVEPERVKSNVPCFDDFKGHRVNWDVVVRLIPNIAPRTAESKKDK